MKQREKLALDLQRYYRGWKEREDVRRELNRRSHYALEQNSAKKIQGLYRIVKARMVCNDLRQARFDELNQAATLLQKRYLGHITRRRYLEMKEDFAAKIPYIITLQKYFRGCGLRQRMYRNAARNEEQLWAAVEIQRIWRGWLGRLAWELRFEQVWSREMGAAMIQRYVRGWVARTRVLKIRRRIARHEFDRARVRFQAAQRLQAWFRGVQVRYILGERKRMVHRAVFVIQRCWRGYNLRQCTWLAVVNKRAVSIQSMIRGWLVRRRLKHLTSNVILIQVYYRLFCRMDAKERLRRVEGVKRRQAAARHIQAHFRGYQMHLADKARKLRMKQLSQSIAVAEEAAARAEAQAAEIRAGSP